MRRNWWENMDLAGWCGDGPVLASVVGDMPFAQAIAAERARWRGRRQRVYVDRTEWGKTVLRVTDAHVVVEEPCS